MTSSKWHSSFGKWWSSNGFGAIIIINPISSNCKSRRQETGTYSIGHTAFYTHVSWVPRVKGISGHVQGQGAKSFSPRMKRAVAAAPLLVDDSYDFRGQGFPLIGSITTTINLYTWNPSKCLGIGLTIASRTIHVKSGQDMTATKRPRQYCLSLRKHLGSILSWGQFPTIFRSRL